jgi:hypothetical protein
MQKAVGAIDGIENVAANVAAAEAATCTSIDVMLLVLQERQGCTNWIDPGAL